MESQEGAMEMLKKLKKPVGWTDNVHAISYNKKKPSVLKCQS
ncbi:hypothetical protein V1226_21850 [Lachnospiraceae bacterium JLR.KK009]|jgi:hypothetical protein